jgi:hypothetical protein
MTLRFVVTSGTAADQRDRFVRPLSVARAIAQGGTVGKNNHNGNNINNNGNNNANNKNGNSFSRIAKMVATVDTRGDMMESVDESVQSEEGKRTHKFLRVCDLDEPIVDGSNSSAPSMEEEEEVAQVVVVPYDNDVGDEDVNNNYKGIDNYSNNNNSINNNNSSNINNTNNNNNRDIISHIADSNNNHNDFNIAQNASVLLPSVSTFADPFLVDLMPEAQSLQMEVLVLHTKQQQQHFLLSNRLRIPSPT